MRALVLMIALLAAGQAVAGPTPRATIADAAWLTGLWEGEGFGGQVQEGWSAPRAGRMVGHFALVADGKPVFHQSLVIEEHEDAIRLRLKHFGPAFVGWEEKDKTVDFAFVSSEPGKLVLGPATFLREGEDGLVLKLVMSQNGQRTEQVLRYRRMGHEHAGTDARD